MHDGQDRVDAAHRDRQVLRDDERPERALIGAEIAPVVETDREEVALGIERELAPPIN